MPSVTNAAQGVKPQALQRVQSQELRRLIELCIAHEPADRPQSRQLLKHPFFESLRYVSGVAINSCWSEGAHAWLSVDATCCAHGGLPPPLHFLDRWHYGRQRHWSLATITPAC